MSINLFMTSVWGNSGSMVVTQILHLLMGMCIFSLSLPSLSITPPLGESGKYSFSHQ